MKLSKQKVNYSKGMKKSHCGQLDLYDKGHCEHFIKPSSCAKVIGKIDKRMWCKLWKKAGEGNES